MDLRLPGAPKTYSSPHPPNPPSLPHPPLLHLTVISTPLMASRNTRHMCADTDRYEHATHTCCDMSHPLWILRHFLLLCCETLLAENLKDFSPAVDCREPNCPTSVCELISALVLMEMLRFCQFYLVEYTSAQIKLP